MAGEVWKRFERKIATDFGGKRHIRASYSEVDEDIDGVDEFVIECKHRKIVNLKESVEQAEGYNKSKYNSKKIPVVAFSKPGTKTTKVALRIRDLKRVCKELGLSQDVIVEFKYEELVACFKKYKGIEQ